MIDPRSEAVLVRSPENGEYEDKTAKVCSYTQEERTTSLVLRRSDGDKRYRYGADRVVILRDPVRLALDDGTWVEVRGERWRSAREVWRFHGPDGWWLRIFYPRREGEAFRTYPEEQVRLVQDVTRSPRAADVLAYWRRIVAALPDSRGQPDPLQRVYKKLDVVHPESVLARYLTGQPIETDDEGRFPIFPFSSNLSQREAVRKALRHPISVIDGPPGTGKTETILNLVAALVATPGTSVGVVSFNNAAVDNVRVKLEEKGVGYVIANLGRSEKRDKFFEHQGTRNAEVDAMVDGAVEEMPSPGSMAELDHQLDRLQQDERRLARLRQDLDAHRLELRHFTRFLGGHDVTDLDGLPLLSRSSGRILDYLAETALADDGRIWPIRWLRRLRWFVRYGPLRGIDPDDSDVVLRLQRAYYERRIGELEQEIGGLERALESAGLARLLEEQQQMSVRYLRASLWERYDSRKRITYDANTYRKSIAAFTAEYPVILSTCHALRDSIGGDRLLDYLIIDEASQVDLLAAGPALASCRRAVVVGDLRQLPQIADETASASAGPAPSPAYDYRAHSILSSLLELYGETLPRTMLREHYRCDPAIIGFCNEKFYDGQLIPYTTGRPGSRPLIHHPTSPGNHMRLHRGGGRSNRREVDVILREAIPQYCPGVVREDIGIATPYRRQVATVADALIENIESLEIAEAEDAGGGNVEADTVHRFQGRQKKVVIMTTVLDESWRGRTGIAFVDDPHLVNVAVSRAVERFVLVTHQEMLPTSRHLRDLMGYIRYHDPDHERAESTVVSVFDLLYRNYSARVRPLAAKLRGELHYRSEDIVWTVLHEILAEEPYAELEAVHHVLLRSLLPELGRLTPEQTAYVQHRASLDMVVYNRITRAPVLAIEVDGFAYHENRPEQLARDALKDAILALYGLPLLRLPTTGSGEPERIRARLDHAMTASRA